MPKPVQTMRGISKDQFSHDGTAYRSVNEMSPPTQIHTSEQAQPNKNIDLFHLLSAMEEYDPNTFVIPNFAPARYSSKKNGEIEAYSAITHEGLIRYFLFLIPLGITTKTEYQLFSTLSNHKIKLWQDGLKFAFLECMMVMEEHNVVIT